MEQAVSTPGLGRRLAAMGYDALLVFSLLFAATGVYSLAAQSLGFSSSEEIVSTGEVVKQIQPVASGPLYRLYLAMVTTTFFVWFWCKSGQTLGMQAWRLRIDRVEGGRIAYHQALLRLLVAALSSLCLGLGYLWILIDPDKCSWHDRASRSRVVLLPKKKKGED